MVNVEIKSKWIRSNFKSELMKLTEITVVKQQTKNKI